MESKISGQRRLFHDLENNQILQIMLLHIFFWLTVKILSHFPNNKIKIGLLVWEVRCHKHTYKYTYTKTCQTYNTSKSSELNSYFNLSYITRTCADVLANSDPLSCSCCPSWHLINTLVYAVCLLHQRIWRYLLKKMYSISKQFLFNFNNNYYIL